MVDELHDHNFSLYSQLFAFHFFCKAVEGNSRGCKGGLGYNLDSCILTGPRVSCDSYMPSRRCECVCVRGLRTGRAVYLPEQPRPMVLPTFQRPIILGSWFFCCKGGKLGTMIEYRNVGPLRNQGTKGIGDRKKNESEASRFCWPRSAAERRQNRRSSHLSKIRISREHKTTHNSSSTEHSTSQNKKKTFFLYRFLQFQICRNRHPQCPRCLSLENQQFLHPLRMWIVPHLPF